LLDEAVYPQRPTEFWEEQDLVRRGRMEKTARLWIYLGPIFLALIEFIVRSVLKAGDPAEIIGPTIAAAAIALLLPLTVLRTLKDQGGGYMRVNQAEVTFVFWLSFAIVFMVILWLIDLLLALKPDSLQAISGLLPHVKVGPIGLCIPVYFVAIGLTEYRESRGWV
jgi:hypothetical protein